MSTYFTKEGEELVQLAFKNNCEKVIFTVHDSGRVSILICGKAKVKK